MLWKCLFLNQLNLTRVSRSSIASALDESEKIKHGAGPHNDGKKPDHAVLLITDKIIFFCAQKY